MNEIAELPDDWSNALSEEINKPYFQHLLSELKPLYANQKIFPPANQVFRAFELCKFNQVKVVMLGQDPYHQAGQAHGLCFSVNAGVRIPPSLRNIYKELSTDIEEFITPGSGDLSAWARQGVLMLNTILTVEAGKPGSHKSKGWQKFTDAVIRTLNDKQRHIVFMLWGNHAIEKQVLIDPKKHLVLTAPHPSPLARGGFFGCAHFSKANAWLTANDISPVNWQL